MLILPFGMILTIAQRKYILAGDSFSGFVKSLHKTTIVVYGHMLIHVPTGKSVKGKVQSGHYSRDQMKQKREQLFKKLYSELEAR